MKDFAADRNAGRSELGDGLSTRWDSERVDEQGISFSELNGRGLLPSETSEHSSEPSGATVGFPLAAATAPAVPAEESQAERGPPSVATDRSVMARARTWWSGASPNLRGSVFMISAFFFFSIMMVLIKLLGQRLPLSQMLIVRQVVVLFGMIALVRGRVLPAMRTSRVGLQLLRGVFSCGAMYFGFSAMIHMPMAEASAFGFSQVLFVTLAAIVVLGEKVNLARWGALLIGFAGILIMLRPGGGALNFYALYAIVGAVFGAGITVTVRLLGETERTETIILWQCAFMIMVLAIPATAQWLPPTPQEWTWLAGLGACGTIAQWLHTKGYQCGEASALAPLDFIRLVLATISGYLVFAEVPDLVTALGATLVVTGTIYTVRSNSRRRAIVEPSIS